MTNDSAREGNPSNLTRDALDELDGSLSFFEPDDGAEPVFEIHGIDRAGGDIHLDVSSASPFRVVSAKEAGSIPVGFETPALQEAASSLADTLAKNARLASRDPIEAALSVREAARFFVSRATEALDGGVPGEGVETALLVAGRLSTLRADDEKGIQSVLDAVRALPGPASALREGASDWVRGWSEHPIVLGQGDVGKRLEAAGQALAQALSKSRSALSESEALEWVEVSRACENVVSVAAETARNARLSPDARTLGDLAKSLAGADFWSRPAFQATLQAVGWLAPGVEQKHPVLSQAVGSARECLMALHDLIPHPIEVVIGDDLRVGEASIEALRRANEAAYGGDASRNDTGQEGGIWESRSGIEWMVSLGSSHGSVPFVDPKTHPRHQRDQALRRILASFGDPEFRKGLALLASDFLVAEERASGHAASLAEPVDIADLAARNPRLSFEDLDELAERIQSERDAAARTAGPSGLALPKDLRLRGGLSTVFPPVVVGEMVLLAEALARSVAKESGARTFGEAAKALRDFAGSKTVPLLPDAVVRMSKVRSDLARSAASKEPVEHLRRVALLVGSKTSPALVERLLSMVPANPDGERIAVGVLSQEMVKVVEGVEARFAARRANGEVLPSFAADKAASQVECGTGAGLALGVFEGSSSYDRALASAGARGMEVKAITPSGKLLKLPQMKEALRSKDLEGVLDAEMDAERRDKDLVKAGLTRTTRNGVEVWAFGDASRLDGNLLSVIGRLSPDEVAKIRAKVKAEGYDGIAWFASPSDPGALPPPGLEPAVIGSRTLGAIGAPGLEWTRTGACSVSEAGIVEARMGVRLDGKHPAILAAAVIPRPGGPDALAYRTAQAVRELDILDKPSCEGVSAFRRADGTIAVFDAPSGKTFDVGRADPSRPVAVAFVRRLDGSLATLAAGAVGDRSPDDVLKDVERVAKRDAALAFAGADHGTIEALRGAVLVGCKRPADLTLIDGLPRSGTADPIEVSGLKPYIAFARALGSDIALLGSAEIDARAVASEGGLRALTLEQSAWSETWDRVGAVGRAALARAEGSLARYPRELARLAAEQRGLSPDEALRLETGLSRHPHAGRSGREMALATVAVLEGQELRGFQASFPLTRTSLPGAQRDARLLMPAELEDASKRIEDRAARLGDLRGASGRDLARKLAETDASPAQAKAAEWVKGLSGSAASLAERASAKALFEDALSKGDAEDAFAILRASALRERLSGRSQQRARESDLGR